MREMRLPCGHFAKLHFSLETWGLYCARCGDRVPDEALARRKKEKTERATGPLTLVINSYRFLEVVIRSAVRAMPGGS